MHVTMVKKKMADGSDCRKCADVTAYLQARGFWDRIDEVVWAYENDPESPGMVLGKRLGVERAPFFVVHDERGETVYTLRALRASDTPGPRRLGRHSLPRLHHPRARPLSCGAAARPGPRASLGFSPFNEAAARCRRAGRTP